MCPDKKRPAENTCRIVKGLDAVWAHFCPSKPCLPLSIDGTYTDTESIIPQIRYGGRTFCKFPKISPRRFTKEEFSCRIGENYFALGRRVGAGVLDGPCPYRKCHRKPYQRPPCVKGAVSRKADWGIDGLRTTPPSRLTPRHLPLHRGGFDTPE